MARERVKYRQLWNRSKQSFDRIKTSRTFRIFLILFWLFEFYGAFFPLPAISIFVSRKTAWLLSPVPVVVAAPVLLLLERGEEIALFSCNSVVVFCNGCFLSELFLRDPLDEVVEELLEGMAVEPTWLDEEEGGSVEGKLLWFRFVRVGWLSWTAVGLSTLGLRGLWVWWSNMYCRLSSFTSLFCTAPKSRSRMSARAPVAAPAAVEALFELSTEARVEVGTAAPWACREEDSVVEAADAAVVLLMMVEQLEDGRGSWCWGWSIVLDLPLKTIKVALNSNVTKHHSSPTILLLLLLLLPLLFRKLDNSGLVLTIDLCRNGKTFWKLLDVAILEST